MNKEMKKVILGLSFNLLKLLPIVLILMTGCYGYWVNILKITKLDFESPYKAEIIRGSGIFFPPIGVVSGYLDIGEESEK